MQNPQGNPSRWHTRTRTVYNWPPTPRRPKSANNSPSSKVGHHLSKTLFAKLSLMPLRLTVSNESCRHFPWSARSVLRSRNPANLKILRDLRQRGFALTSHRNNITTELHRECFRHDNFLPARTKSSQINSQPNPGQTQARVIVEDWRHDYNTNRPHTAHGELTPNEFALHWNTTHQPQAA